MNFASIFEFRETCTKRPIPSGANSHQLSPNPAQTSPAEPTQPSPARPARPQPKPPADQARQPKPQSSAKTKNEKQQTKPAQNLTKLSLKTFGQNSGPEPYNPKPGERSAFVPGGWLVDSSACSFLRFRVSGFQGLGFRVWGLGFQGFGFRVSGFRV